MTLQRMDAHSLAQMRFGLVDATLRDQVPQGVEQVVIAPTFLGADTERCPTLVLLQEGASASATGALFDLLFSQIETRDEPLCSLLLDSELDAERLAARLAQRMTVRDPADTTPRQFRFFDPGTFLQLPGLLGDAGMAWLLGSISRVAVPWAGGAWAYLPPAGPMPFWLQADHLQALHRLSIVNRVAAQLAPPADVQEWQQCCRHIDAHATRGTLQGLTTQADLVAFALDAMRHHPEFDRHPRLVAVFKALREAGPEDELDYRELTARLTPQQWQEIVLDMSRRPQPEGSPT